MIQSFRSLHYTIKIFCRKAVFLVYTPNLPFLDFVLLHILLSHSNYTHRFRLTWLYFNKHHISINWIVFNKSLKSLKI